MLNELKKDRSNLNTSKIILIGHSGGGDIAMMFASKYSDRVYKIISLDSLRYPFIKNIPILHFIATDTKADKGIVPSNGIETSFY